MNQERKLLKEKVRQLRSEGETYSEIGKKLSLTTPKSTLSDWCQDVIMPSWYQAKVESLNIRNFRKAQEMSWVSNKIKREKLLRELEERNSDVQGKLRDRTVLRALLAILHLGEGAKWHSHRGLMLGSSDPDIIRLYLRLLQLCYGINPRTLKCRISYRVDQDIYLLQKYWSEITSIPIENFYKTIPDPRTKGKPTKRKEYKGVCVIMGGTTTIQLELELISKLILKGL